MQCFIRVVRACAKLPQNDCANLALLDLVALRGAEPLVSAGAEALASLGVETLVASTDNPLFRHPRRGERAARRHLPATAEEEDRHFDAGSADFDLWLPGVRDHVIGEGAALVERARARTGAEHWLALDVGDLVDVQRHGRVGL